MWHYRKGCDPHNQGQVSNEATGATVAITYNDEDGSHARLIAAAPELLAALANTVGAMDAILEYLETGRYDGSVACNLRSCIEACEAAITKATKA